MAMGLLNHPPRWVHPVTDGDGIMVLVLGKTLAQQPWFAHNTHLGYPGELNTLFPLGDNGHLLIIKFLTLLGLSPPASIDCYYLLSFFLAAAAAFCCMESLGLRRPLACAGAVIYTLLPYHFLRGVSHLYLAAYFMVPMAVWTVLQLAHPNLPRNRRRLCWLWCLIIPAFGVYYAFFMAFLLAAHGLLESVAQRLGKVARHHAQALGWVALGTALQLYVPILAALHGDPVNIPRRPAADAEVYSLKLTQMLLPSLHHLGNRFSKAHAHYVATAPLVNENGTANLGLLASIAFVMVVGLSLVRLLRPTPAPAGSVALRLSVMVWLSFSYATTGGLASLVSYVGFRPIRATNRIVVYIAFCVILAALLTLQRTFVTRRRWGPWVCCAALMGVLLYDLNSYGFGQNYAQAAALQARDAAFFSQLEAQLPPAAALFQLPYLPYPEGGLGIRDYDGARPYLHTAALRFSFGAARRSAADAWQAWAATLLPQQPRRLAQTLQEHGITGVLVNKVQLGLSNNDLGPLGKSLQPQLHSDDYAYYSVAQLQALPCTPADLRTGLVALKKAALDHPVAHFAVDELTQDRHSVHITGWAYLPQADAAGATLSLLLADEAGDTVLVAPTTPQLRTDLARAFPQVPHVEQGGYAATLPTPEAVPAGTYRLGVMVRAGQQVGHTFSQQRITVAP
jgi:phosphoglycerol transferase